MNHTIHHRAGPPAHSGTEGEVKGKKEGMDVRATRLQMVKKKKEQRALNLRQSSDSEDDGVPLPPDSPRSGPAEGKKQCRKRAGPGTHSLSTHPGWARVTTT